MPDKPGGLVVWGGGSPAPARERQRAGAAVVCWPGAPASSLERKGIPLRAVEDVLGPEGLLREERRRLRGTPGLAGSYAHRGIPFADLASDPRPVVARLREAARGRVEAG